MFGPKITQVFKSRWHALFWSAGILTTAYCTVPSPDDSDDSGQDQLQAAQQVVSGWGIPVKK
jgi:hypothetical protein